MDPLIGVLVIFAVLGVLAFLRMALDTNVRDDTGEVVEPGDTSDVLDPAGPTGRPTFRTIIGQGRWFPWWPFR